MNGKRLSSRKSLKRSISDLTVPGGREPLQPHHHYMHTTAHPQATSSLAATASTPSSHRTDGLRDMRRVASIVEALTSRTVHADRRQAREKTFTEELHFLGALRPLMKVAGLVPFENPWVCAADVHSPLGYAVWGVYASCILLLCLWRLVRAATWVDQRFAWVRILGGVLLYPVPVICYVFALVAIVRYQLPQRVFLTHVRFGFVLFPALKEEMNEAELERRLGTEEAMQAQSTRDLKLMTQLSVSNTGAPPPAREQHETRRLLKITQYTEEQASLIRLRSRQLALLAFVFSSAAVLLFNIPRVLSMARGELHEDLNADMDVWLERHTSIGVVTVIALLGDVYTFFVSALLWALLLILGFVVFTQLELLTTDIERPRVRRGSSLASGSAPRELPAPPGVPFSLDGVNHGAPVRRSMSSMSGGMAIRMTQSRRSRRSSTDAEARGLSHIVDPVSRQSFHAQSTGLIASQNTAEHSDFVDLSSADEDAELGVFEDDGVGTPLVNEVLPESPPPPEQPQLDEADSARLFHSRVAALTVNKKQSREIWQIGRLALGAILACVCGVLVVQIALLIWTTGSDPGRSEFIAPLLGATLAAFMWAFASKNKRMSQKVSRLLLRTSNKETPLFKLATSRGHLPEHESVHEALTRPQRLWAKVRQSVIKPKRHHGHSFADIASYWILHTLRAISDEAEEEERAAAAAAEDDDDLEESLTESGDDTQPNTGLHTQLVAFLDWRSRSITKEDKSLEARKRFVSPLSLPAAVVARTYKSILLNALVSFLVCLVLAVVRVLIQYPRCVTVQTASNEEIVDCDDGWTMFRDIESGFFAGTFVVMAPAYIIWRSLHQRYVLRSVAWFSLVMALLSCTTTFVLYRTVGHKAWVRGVVWLGFVCNVWFANVRLGRQFRFTRVFLFTLAVVSMLLLGFFLLVRYVVLAFADANSDDQRFVIVVVFHPLLGVVAGSVVMNLTHHFQTKEFVRSPYVLYALTKLAFGVIGRLFLSNLETIGAQVFSIALFTLGDILTTTTIPLRAQMLWRFACQRDPKKAFEKSENRRANFSLVHEIYLIMYTQLFAIPFAAIFSYITKAAAGAPVPDAWFLVVSIALQLGGQMIADLLSVYVAEGLLDVKLLDIWRRFDTSWAYVRMTLPLSVLLIFMTLHEYFLITTTD